MSSESDAEYWGEVMDGPYEDEVTTMRPIQLDPGTHVTMEIAGRQPVTFASASLSEERLPGRPIATDDGHHAPSTPSMVSGTLSGPQPANGLRGLGETVLCAIVYTSGGVRWKSDGSCYFEEMTGKRTFTGRSPQRA